MGASGAHPLGQRSLGGMHPDGGSGVSNRGAAPDPSAFLKRSIRVGSIHSQLNYGAGERATHSSEMPARAREARAWLAGGRARDEARFRSETSTYHVPVSRTLENFDHDPTEYKFNFRAEELPHPRPVVYDPFGRPRRVLLGDGGHFHRTQEMPVHHALEGKPRWDLSTQLPYAERLRASEALVRTCNAAAARATARLTAASTGGYVGPAEAETARNLARREARRAAESAAADPQRREAARAAALQWTANVRDAVSHAEALTPFAAPPGGGELRWAGATALGALPPALSGTLGATSSHLEAHYEALVAPIRVKTAEKHARGTRWAYGSI
jgi:hypothetical protein